MILAWLLACSEDPTAADPAAVDPIVDELEASDTLPEDEQDEALDRGGVLYVENCASCHGSRGDGSVDLERVPSDRLVEQILVGSVEQVYGAMPPFEDVLTADEIADVAFYVEVELWGSD